jgi:hypothetical protein
MILQTKDSKKNIEDSGGEKEIRTLDTFYSIHAFQASAFNHSATSPIFFLLLKYFESIIFLFLF